MAVFQQLRDVLSQAIQGRRLGAPVSLRLFVQLSADHGHVESWLGQAVALAGECFGDDVLRVYATGTLASGQLTAHLLWAGGQTALLNIGTCGMGRAGVEAVLIGNQGVLTYEPDPWELAQDSLPRDAIQAQPRAEVLTALRRSWQDRVPVALRGPAAPAMLPAGPARPAAGPGPSRYAPLAGPIGLLLIGGSYTHQEGYARDLARDPRVRLIGITDAADITPRRRELNARLAQELNIPVLPDLQAALRSEDVQVISICPEPDRRGPLVLACAAAGKPLYLDKPLCGKPEEVDAIRTAIQRANVNHQMFSLVHTPWARRARDLVQSGRLGELQAIHCDLFFAKGQSGTATLGQPRQETFPPASLEAIDTKRELSNVGVYPLVFLQWLLGRAPRTIYSVTANYFFAEHQRNDMEDFGQMVVEWDGGLISSIGAGRTGWTSHRGSGVNKIYLCGTNGVACVDAFRPRGEVFPNDEPWAAPARDADDPMGFWLSTSTRGVRPKKDWLMPGPAGLDDAAYFVECLTQGRPSDVPIAHAAGASELLFAAYRSAAEARVVALPLALG